MIVIWTVLIILIICFGLVVFHGSPYVPTRKKHLHQALTELYKIDKNDVLVDIGSGDGAVLREAASLGARAIGYEINPVLVFLSRFLSRKHKKITINFADFWFISLPKSTTVIYVFSVSRDMKNIVKLIQKQVNHLNKPLYLISYGNSIDVMEPIKTVGAYTLYMIKPLQPHKAQV